MMLPAILLSAALTPQVTPPPKPGEPKTTEMAPSSAGAAQPSIDAGLAAFKKHRYGNAEIDFRKALDADPKSAAANFYLGYTYYKMNEKKGRNNPEKLKSLPLFVKAYELDPGFQPVWGQKAKK